MKKIAIGFLKDNEEDIQIKAFDSSDKFIEFCRKNYSKIYSINYNRLYTRFGKVKPDHFDLMRVWMDANSKA